MTPSLRFLADESCDFAVVRALRSHGYDIAVFEREKVLAEGLTDEYVQTPPLVVIEVDTKADLARYEGQVEWYMREKTDDLLNAGVQQVLWYTTRDRRVLVAEQGKR